MNRSHVLIATTISASYLAILVCVKFGIEWGLAVCAVNTWAEMLLIRTRRGGGGG